MTLVEPNLSWYLEYLSLPSYSPFLHPLSISNTSVRVSFSPDFHKKLELILSLFIWATNGVEIFRPTSQTYPVLPSTLCLSKSREGLWRWLGNGNISHIRRCWESWACLAWRRLRGDLIQLSPKQNMLCAGSSSGNEAPKTWSASALYAFNCTVLKANISLFTFLGSFLPRLENCPTLTKKKKKKSPSPEQGIPDTRDVTQNHKISTVAESCFIQSD